MPRSGGGGLTARRSRCAEERAPSTAGGVRAPYKKAPGLAIWNQTKGRRVLLGGNQAWMNKQHSSQACRREVAGYGTWEGWTMTAKECPESGERRALRFTLALWAGRIVLIAIAGVISILSGISLVIRFFGGH